MSEFALFTAIETDCQISSRETRCSPPLGLPRRPAEALVKIRQPAGHTIRPRRSHASWKRQESENIAEEAVAQWDVREQAGASQKGP